MNYQHLFVIIILLFIGILILTAVNNGKTESFCGMGSIGVGLSFIILAALIFARS